MLRRLDPAGRPLDILDMLFADARGRTDRPWVILNMVSSIDGATAVGGGASGLNDADDRALFRAMRAVADVVLVGAQTVRAEGYGPIRLDEAMASHRSAAGLEGVPKLVILSRSLDIDRDSRVFSDPAGRPTILTGIDSDPEGIALLEDVADIEQIDSLDGAGIVGHLDDARVILCEGGPRVNSQLIAAGVVDEIALTLAPMVALGESQRMAHGPSLDPALEMRLDRAVTGERSLFLRYIRL